MLRTGEGEQWVESLYNHPLILSLYKGERYEPGSKALPAYIPKENFSLAILDLAAKASQTGKVLSMAKLSQSLTAIAEPNAVQRVVLTALAAGGNDIEKVRGHIEHWYDGTMDRVTSWYAKRTAWILFLIGFAAAIVLNVDAITIAERLVVDRPLREAIVTEAETYVRNQAAKQPDVKAPAGNGADAPASQPTTADKAPAAPAAQSNTSDGTSQSQSFRELRTEFEKLGFPVGWEWRFPPYPAPQASAREAAGHKLPFDGWDYVSLLLEALPGWLITAVAIMLGAPFWFDLLNKLVSLRSALKPPEKKVSS